MNEGRIPRSATVIDRIDESPTVFTLRLRLEEDPDTPFVFRPGQFNMVGVFGVGEVPLSIVSDPLDIDFFDHTVRIVGRVTTAMARVRPGERLGIRGPFGSGWPVEQAVGRDIVLVSGGLGCAPLVSVVNYISRRRDQFGQMTLLHGVKSPEEMIYRERFKELSRQDRTRILLTSDRAGDGWEGSVGPVTALLDDLRFNPDTTSAKLCGPEPMMVAAVKKLITGGMAEEEIFVSLERSMQCAEGLCGHCMLVGHFICRDGPVFRYRDIRPLLEHKGL